MGPSHLTRQIKEKSRQLGFDSIGIAPIAAIPEDHLQGWLRDQYHGEMGYMERNTEKRLDPEKLLPGARSILSLALNYFHPYELPYERSTRGSISRYASGDDYHQVLKKKLQELLDFVREREPGVQEKIYIDTGPVLDKYWAARSGVGWLGKHTNVLARNLGSWFFLGEILLTLDLEYDLPSPDFCGSCTRCIEACPTGAIVEPYRLDSRRCISYLTIELREDIPEKWREPMGNLIFGCDICQDVCPWNRQAPDSRVEEFKPRKENRAPELKELARLSAQDFRKRYRGSPMKRTRWRGLMRNVAVAMGNSRDPEMIPELESMLNLEDPMVRRHAAWALARIGTLEALEALRQRMEREENEETRGTLEKILHQRLGRETPEDIS